MVELVVVCLPFFVDSDTAPVAMFSFPRRRLRRVDLPVPDLPEKSEIPLERREQIDSQSSPFGSSKFTAKAE